MTTERSVLIASAMIICTIVIAVGAILIWSPSLTTPTPPLAPTNLRALDIARTCASFDRLNEETQCNEHIVECKNPEGEVVFLNAAC